MEADMLKRMGGRGTINPKTGLPEFGFWKSLGNIFKIGAQIVGAAILTPFVGPIAAGAIVSGASALLSGAKPADALKSALIGGALGGVTAGFMGSGSFTENAFAGGSLFGSGPAASPMLDWMKSTSIGGSLLGGAPAAGGAEVAPTIDATKVATGPGGGEVYSADPSKAVTSQVVKPSISVSNLADSATNWIKNNKALALLGGGALLLGMGQNKEDIKPSIRCRFLDKN
jgi:hypothetical protein